MVSAFCSMIIFLEEILPFKGLFKGDVTPVRGKGRSYSIEGTVHERGGGGQILLNLMKNLLLSVFLKAL